MVGCSQHSQTSSGSPTSIQIFFSTFVIAFRCYDKIVWKYSVGGGKTDLGSWFLSSQPAMVGEDGRRDQKLVEREGEKVCGWGNMLLCSKFPSLSPFTPSGTSNLWDGSNHIESDLTATPAHHPRQTHQELCLLIF